MENETKPPTILAEIQNRRAKRAFSGAPLPSGIAKRLIAAAHLAPSCGNKQSWRFVTVENPGNLEKLRATFADGNYWALPAPLLIAVYSRAEDGMRMEGGREYAGYDTGMASMNLMLQAEYEGVCAHPMAGVDAPKVKELLNIPSESALWVVFAVAKTGDHTVLKASHQAQESSPRTRKPLEEVCFEETVKS